MDLFERLGREKPGTRPELEVAEPPTADAPDSVLFQGTWETEKGEFLLEFEGLAETAKILWLRISEWSDGGGAVADLSDLTEFANRYPLCMEELTAFCREART